MTASEKYVLGTEKELDEFRDKYIENVTGAENYCRVKHEPKRIHRQTTSI